MAQQEDQSSARQLRVLWRLEPAVRAAAVVVHRSGLVGSQAPVRRAAAITATPVVAGQRQRQSGAARVLQVRRVFAGEFPGVDDGDGCGLPAAGLATRVARRDLVLNLPEPGLFSGCLTALGGVA